MTYAELQESLRVPGLGERFRFFPCEEEFYEQNPEERIRRQFADDPLWGKGD